jgi:hypothetical protein
MRMLSSNEIGFVSGGSEALETVDVIASRIRGPRGSSQQWAPLSAMSREQLMEQQGGIAALIGVILMGLVTNYVYEKIGGAEGIDQSIEDFEKWVDEKAKELSAATGMAIDDAKCLLKTVGSSGPGGGAPMTCSMTGATGSW